VSDSQRSNLGLHPSKSCSCIGRDALWSWLHSGLSLGGLDNNTAMHILKLLKRCKNNDLMHLAQDPFQYFCLLGHKVEVVMEIIVFLHVTDHIPINGNKY